MVGITVSEEQVKAANELRGSFPVETRLLDYRNLVGHDYDKTLMCWHRNFEENRESLKRDYGERFYRMWRYYLLSCAGSFRARQNQLWQIVFSPRGIQGGYHAPR